MRFPHKQITIYFKFKFKFFLIGRLRLRRGRVPLLGGRRLRDALQAVRRPQGLRGRVGRVGVRQTGRGRNGERGINNLFFYGECRALWRQFFFLSDGRGRTLFERSAEGIGKSFGGLVKFLKVEKQSNTFCPFIFWLKEW